MENENFVGSLPSGTAVQLVDPEDEQVRLLAKKGAEVRRIIEADMQALLAEKASLEARIKSQAEEQLRKAEDAESKALEALVTSFIMGSQTGQTHGYKIRPTIDGGLYSARIVAKDNVVIAVRAGQPLNPVFILNINYDRHWKIADLLEEKLNTYMKAYILLNRSQLPFCYDVPPVITRET
jgi:hypothetical protein